MDAHCPHCTLVVDTRVSPPWPRRSQRCPHCRLLIGAGRGRSPSDGGAAVVRGAAAGVMANRARRAAAHAQPTSEDRERVIAGLRAAAETLGTKPERLVMLDYQQAAAADAGLPPLADVLGAFGNWKEARRRAAAGS